MAFYAANARVRQMVDVVLLGQRRPCFIPCLNRHVGVGDDLSADDISYEGTALLNFAQLLTFAPTANTGIDNPPTLDLAVDYAKRFLTKNDPAGRLLGDDLDSEHPIKAEDRIANRYLYDDLNRALCLAGLSGVRYARQKAVFNSRKPCIPTAKVEHTRRFLYRHPSLSTSDLADSDASADNAFSNLSAEQLKHFAELTHASTTAIDREIKRMRRDMRADDAPEREDEDIFAYYDPEGDPEARDARGVHRPARCSTGVKGIVR